MPCRTDYLDPNQREQELQRAAKLLLYVCKATNITPEAWVVAEAKNQYAKDERSVTKLCAILKKMDATKRDAIVYNARNKTARDLADWWEEHQAADKEREKNERRQKEQKALRKQALLKLTKKEIIALGLGE